jgi:two-component system cell cycle sensor histidine kinase/response regulator CckA
MGRSGTGLGMAVVWSTVKDHHGHIRVDTEKGRGTTFDLYFPATRDNLPRSIDSVPLETFKGTETILVVDDVREQRELAREMLSGLGYRVKMAASGEEAVESVRASTPDLLVLDMIMDPGIDGLDTYRKIIELRPGQKAIIASGFSETDRVRQTQELGARTCILKPYTLDKLAAAVREELDRTLDA